MLFMRVAYILTDFIDIKQRLSCILKTAMVDSMYRELAIRRLYYIFTPRWIQVIGDVET
jgi:hypothetical protein